MRALISTELTFFKLMKEERCRGLAHIVRGVGRESTFHICGICWVKWLIQHSEFKLDGPLASCDVEPQGADDAFALRPAVFERPQHWAW
jgi:hypothetical protein